MSKKKIVAIILLIMIIYSLYFIKTVPEARAFANMEYAEGYWCDTIDYVSEYYKGLITYR